MKKIFLIFFVVCAPLLLGGCGAIEGGYALYETYQQADRATGGAVSRKVETTVRENGGLLGLYEKGKEKFYGLVGGFLSGEKSPPSATRSTRRKAEIPFVRVKPDKRKIRFFPPGENPRVWSRDDPFPPPDRESPPAVAGAAI